jgi:hypothetical protein
MRFSLWALLILLADATVALGSTSDLCPAKSEAEIGKGHLQESNFYYEDAAKSIDALNDANDAVMEKDFNVSDAQERNFGLQIEILIVKGGLLRLRAITSKQAFLLSKEGTKARAVAEKTFSNHKLEFCSFLKSSQVVE